MDPKNHPLIKRLARVLLVFGVLWILSFPFMARQVFTSENALNTEYLGAKFDSDPSALFSFYKSLD